MSLEVGFVPRQGHINILLKKVLGLFLAVFSGNWRDKREASCRPGRNSSTPRESPGEVRCSLGVRWMRSHQYHHWAAKCPTDRPGWRVLRREVLHLTAPGPPHRGSGPDSMSSMTAAPVVLCFLLRPSGASGLEGDPALWDVLLGLKKRGFGQGKVVAIGGHVEAGRPRRRPCSGRSGRRSTS